MAISCGNDIEPFDPDDGGGSGNGGGNGGTQVTVSWKSRAQEFYSTICQNYQIRTGATAGLFYEYSPSPDGSSSFLWPYDGLMSGLANLNRLGVDVKYESMVEKYQCYYRADGVGGYGSSTNGTNGGGDRFYDDNSIIGLNLVDAYNQTGKQVYLDRAAQIVRFLRTGADETFGYALWWNESQKNKPGRDDSNKPACANGYALWFLMSYYDVCPQSEKAEVLDFAKKLYNFLYTTLRDPEDNVYWNSKQADGSINKTKWTYNSGAMIAGGFRLYKATGSSSYLTQAKATADGAYNYFARPRNPLPLSYPTNDPWFTIKLIKSYMELEPEHPKCKAYIETFVSNLEYAWNHARMSSGLFYEDWTGQKHNSERDSQLLMQDAVLESLSAIALYKNEK